MAMIIAGFPKMLYNGAVDKIVIRDVDFSYDDQQVVLKSFSCTFEKGKHYVILGHNGSGKSTLAKLIAGLILPQRGTIEIDGVLLNPKSVAKLRQKIGIVFQNPDNQFIGSTVADDIAFGLENRRIPYEEMASLVPAAASKVGMGNLLEREPAQLSGGQKQRVAIAGIIALNPEIIIFDESTSMLDPQGRSEVHHLLLQMKQDNPDLTVISITHNVEEALEADYLLVISHGELAAFGPPKHLFDTFDFPAHQLELPFFYALNRELKKVGKQLPDYNLAGVRKLWR